MSQRKANWQEVPLKHLALLNPDVLPESTAPDYQLAYVDIGSVSLENGIEKIEEIAFSAAPSRARRRVRDGDIIVSTVRTYLRAIAPIVDPPDNLVVSTGFAVVRPRPGVNSRFLSYALRSNAFVEFVVAESVGVSYPAIAPTKLGTFGIWLGPLQDQCEIADLLDRETAKIDALITKQKELIRAAIQKRTAESDFLLTRGTDDHALLPSPVPWLGEAPTSWDFVRAKFLFRERSDPPADDEGVVTAFRDGQVTLRSNRRSDGFTFAELEVGYQRVFEGDLVIHSMDAFAGAIGVSESTGKCTGEYAVCVPRDNTANNEYYAQILRLMARRGYIFVLCPSVRERAPRFRFVRFADTLLPVPPRPEQDRIVARLAKIQGRYNSLIGRCEEQVRLLHERRSALITAAVTGQIQVVVTPEPIHQVAISANYNRQALRAAVGTEIVLRHASAKSFGRVKLQKLLYLAEVHAGVHELSGSYVREAAGPLARDLLSETERGMAAEGFFRTLPPEKDGQGYTYSRIGNAEGQRDQFTTMLGARAEPVRKLIDLLKGFDTLKVEAITTLYAVWNDALIDGETATDDRIIRGVLEEWHPEKKDKFTATDLKTWLAWMKRNGVVPTGTGSRTQLDRLFV